jgi:DedD protein
MAKMSTGSAIDESDAQQELKRRARRRLIGAIALALAAVVLLPMVMDREPRPPAQDIQVRIPSQDAAGGIASRMLAGKPSTPLPPVAVPESPAKATTPESAPESTTAQPVPQPAAVKPAVAKPAAATSAVTKADDKKQAPSARAEAALSGAGSDAGAQWIVKLGAYKDGGNVKALVSKLKGMGLPSYTEQFSSAQGPRTRVRAGPFATKEAAEKAQAKAKTIGVNGSVAQK